MTRDELEADLWRTLTKHRVDCNYPAAFVDALVAVCIHWLNSDGDEQTAARRKALAKALR